MTKRTGMQKLVELVALNLAESDQSTTLNLQYLLLVNGQLKPEFSHRHYTGERQCGQLCVLIQVQILESVGVLLM